MEGEKLLNVTEEIIHYIDHAKGDLIKLTEDLLKINTSNPPGENFEELTRYIANWLSEIGVKVEVIETTKTSERMLQPDAKGPRFIVISRIKGSSGSPSLHFNGHYDTVPPVKGWTKEPFEPVIENNRLYGLGASDMKGGIASMMFSLKSLIEYNVNLRGDLVISLTPDEEHGSKAGIEYLFNKGLTRSDYAIVGEGSGIRNVVIGQKGAIWGEIIVHGRAAHGSTPYKGVNALEKLAKVVFTFDEKFRPVLMQRKSSYPFRFEQDSFSTIMLGGIVGCATKNRAVIPDYCIVSFDRRIIPEENLREAENEILQFLLGLQQEDPELRAELRVTKRGKGFVTNPDTDLCKILEDVIISLAGEKPNFALLSGWGEGLYFSESNAKTVYYGPGAGCAHAKDEYVVTDDLVTAAKVYALTTLKLIG